MLKKLLKYDIENILKILTTFYLLALFFGILTRLFLNIENSFIMNIIGQICSGVTISMIVNILINNLMRLWVRFKNNFYGDEAYLTHTLPLSKKTLYLSKILTAVITLFISIVIIGITLYIAYYSQENIKILKNILLPVANILDSTITKLLVSFLFVFFLEFVNVLQSGYTGIILGHRMNNTKTAFSILFGFITYILTQVFVLSIIYIIGLFNQDIMNLFITNNLVNIDIIKFIIYITIIIYTIIFVITYIINNKIFNKGVNID